MTRILHFSLLFPLTHVAIDNLHLFLWVSDVLLNVLITELRRQDAIDKLKQFSSFEISRYKHIQGFQQFVKSLGIPGFEVELQKS